MIHVHVFLLVDTVLHFNGYCEKYSWMFKMVVFFFFLNGIFFAEMSGMTVNT